MITGILDLLQVGKRRRIAGILRIFLQDLAVADDRIEWRAQFVAHIRQELGLHLRRAFRIILRLLQFVLPLLQSP